MAPCFQTTHWTVVLAAGLKNSPESSSALQKLCAAYWYPLYAFIRRRGYTVEEAEDLTQEFFYRFLERDSLMNVSPAAGRFRSFLLACVKNFLANEHERAKTQRRGGGCPPIHLEGGAAETRYSLEPADHLTPEVLFERRWAFTVLDRTLEVLRQEYARREKSGVFDEMKGFLPGGQAGASRSELAAKHAISVGAVDVAIHRLRQRFGARLREQVAQTVSAEGEVDEEIRYLISVLGS